MTEQKKRKEGLSLPPIQRKTPQKSKAIVKRTRDSKSFSALEEKKTKRNEKRTSAGWTLNGNNTKESRNGRGRERDKRENGEDSVAKEPNSKEITEALNEANEGKKAPDESDGSNGEMKENSKEETNANEKNSEFEKIPKEDPNLNEGNELSEDEIGPKTLDEISKLFTIDREEEIKKLIERNKTCSVESDKTFDPIEATASSALATEWKAKYPDLPVWSYLKERHTKMKAKMIRERIYEQLLCENSREYKEELLKREQMKREKFQLKLPRIEEKVVGEFQDIVRKVLFERPIAKEAKQEKLLDLSQQPQMQEEFHKVCIDRFWEAKMNRRIRKRERDMERVIDSLKTAEKKQKEEKFIEKKKEIEAEANEPPDLKQENFSTSFDAEIAEIEEKAAKEAMKSRFYKENEIKKLKGKWFFKKKELTESTSYKMSDYEVALGLCRHFGLEAKKMENRERLINRPKLVQKKINSQFRKISNEYQNFHFHG